MAGGKCDGTDGSGGDIKINLDKKLSEADIRSILSKTSVNLGWSKANAPATGSKGYQVKKTFTDGHKATLAITEISDSDLFY